MKPLHIVSDYNSKNCINLPFSTDVSKMESSNRRLVAVTGIGMVTPLGNDTKSSWCNLIQRKSGIDRIQSFDSTGFNCQIAGEVKNFEISNYFSKNKISKYISRLTGFALVAADEALKDAGIRPTNLTSDRWGLVAGAGMVQLEFDAWRDFQGDYAPHGELDIASLGQRQLFDITPSEFGKFQLNTGVSILAKQFDIKGYVNSVHTACSSGGQALGLGLQALRRGDVDYILAGGYDSMINPICLGGFCLLGALSCNNDDPQTASRPFDLTRNGFVLAEGAAFLVLEDWEKAVERKARIYAEFAGEGNSLSSYRFTDSHPTGDGAIQAIEGALKDAQISPTSIDYINAHGTSTKMNDLSETNAIKAVFGDLSYKIPMSSTKSQTGHLICAAGALEGAFCALAIHHGVIPMTLNLNQPDPECDLNYVSQGPQKMNIRAAISNSFGFGGSNSSLVFRHPHLTPINGVLKKV